MHDQNKNNPPQRKKRKKTDRAYRPGTSRTKPLDPSSFCVESLIKLNQCAESPAKVGVVIDSTKIKYKAPPRLYTPSKKHAGTQMLSPSQVTLSTPDKGPFTSHVITKSGEKLLPSRLIECDDGACTLFLSENKITHQTLVIPAKGSAWLKKSPVPIAHDKGFIDVEITKKSIKATEALIRKRKKEGLPPRQISQNKLMGIPANQALKKAGISAPPDTMHWVHFISHAFINDASQTVANLGLGTKQANLAMELVNPVIKRLLYKKGAKPAIYLSVIPEFLPGFKSIRLLKSITMVIKDAKGDDFKHKASIKFDMLSLQKVCLTDVQPIRKFIMKKFSNKPPKNNENAQASSPILHMHKMAKLRSQNLSPTKFSGSPLKTVSPSPMVKKPKIISFK